MTSRMTPILALARKDILIYLSNRKALIITLLGPIVMAASFGFLFNTASSKKPVKLPTAVVDLDQSAVSRAMVEAMAADANIDVLVTDEANALQLVQGGKRRVALVIPKAFGADAMNAMWTRSQKPEVRVLYDPSQSYALGIANGLLAQHAMQAVFRAQMNDTSQVSRLRESITSAPADGGTPTPPALQRELLGMLDSIGRVNAEAAKSEEASGTAATSGTAPGVARRGGFAMEPPFKTQSLEVTAARDGVMRKYNSFAHSFAGMSVQFILFMGIDFGIGLLVMRRTGIWQRLRIAPISRTDLIGSRIAASALIGFAFMAVIYAVAMAFFGVRVDGSWIGLVLVVLAFALLNASLGLLIAALGNSPDAARGLSILATLVLVMIGGAWVPSFMFPEWLQTVSQFTPTHWAVEGLSAMTWRGLGLGHALTAAGAMLGYAALFTAVALWRFKWDE